MRQLRARPYCSPRPAGSYRRNQRAGAADPQTIEIDSVDALPSIEQQFFDVSQSGKIKLLQNCSASISPLPAWYFVTLNAIVRRYAMH